MLLPPNANSTPHLNHRKAPISQRKQHSTIITIERCRERIRQELKGTSTGGTVNLKVLVLCANPLSDFQLFRFSTPVSVESCDSD